MQYACEQADIIPKKIDQLAQKLHNSDSLLSVNDLQQQLAAVKTRLQSSSGIAKTHLDQLAISLQRNIELAQQGQDSRIVQVISLLTLIQDSLGVLQQLQNQLRHADLTNSTQILELRSLSQQFNSYQENVNLLVDN